MTQTLNGTPPSRVQRKNLADQLNRLDSIIDALDVGLTGAVKKVVKNADGNWACFQSALSSRGPQWRAEAIQPSALPWGLEFVETAGLLRQPTLWAASQ